MQAHLRGDLGLVTGSALHTARVKARRSRALLREEAKARGLQVRTEEEVTAACTGGGGGGGDGSGAASGGTSRAF